MQAVHTDRVDDNRVSISIHIDGSALVGSSAKCASRVLLKIEHGHIESLELRPPNLARLHICLVARWSPIFSLIGQREVALKNESRY